MRFDESIRNILVLKLKFSPASTIKLERNPHLVAKIVEAIDTLKQKGLPLVDRQYALAQIQHIKKLVEPKDVRGSSLAQERKAYYSFSRA